MIVRSWRHLFVLRSVLMLWLTLMRYCQTWIALIVADGGEILMLKKFGVAGRSAARIGYCYAQKLLTHPLLKEALFIEHVNILVMLYNRLSISLLHRGLMLMPIVLGLNELMSM